jgi:hypothetical protein
MSGIEQLFRFAVHNPKQGDEGHDRQRLRRWDVLDVAPKRSPVHLMCRKSEQLWN